MQKCSWCGCENDDLQPACSRCGTEFNQPVKAAGGIDRKTPAALGYWLGFGLQLVGNGLLSRGHNVWTQFLGVDLELVGAGLVVWGCVNYAAGKGYSRWFGAFGLLSCIGLFILMAPPDRRQGYDDHTS